MKKSTLLIYFLIVLVVINVIFYLTRLGGDGLLAVVSDLLPVICSFIAVLSLIHALRGFKSFDFTKISWMLLLIGMSFNFLAETTYGVLEIGLKVNMNDTFPTLADFFWCFGYIPLIAGLVMMIIGYWRSGLPFGNAGFYGMIVLLLLIVSSAVIYFLLIDIVLDPETTSMAKVFYLYYPIGDMFLVIPAAILFYITSLFGGTITRPWKYLTIGFISFTIADLLFSYLSWQDAYGSGNLIDVAWHLGYLIIGLSALYQRELIESINETIS